MAQVYNEPITRAFDNLGKVGVGFQKFFYDTGTTAKKSIFAEAALTTPLTNPVISDANGYFPQIFMEGTGNDYKTVLADATDTDPPTSPIWTADPVEVDANDINAFGTRPAQHWGTTTNTAVDYQISPNTALSAYTDDLLFSLQIHLTNTGAATFAVEDLNNLGSFLTALDVKKYDGAGNKIDIEPGDWQAGQTYIVRIDNIDAIVISGIETLIASQAETDAGTDDKKIVTPLKLATKGFMFKSIQTFTSSGTYTRPSGVTSVLIKGIGSGGGGGGGSDDSSPVANGAGAGGGGYLEKFITSIGTVLTVTIAAGGAAGGAASNGTAAADSVFDTILIKGGLGGLGSTGNPVAGGAGGNPTAGDINVKGDDGEGTSQGSRGGSSALGYGFNSFSLGDAGKEFGGGGAGGSTSVSGLPGGAGASGIIIVYEYA